MKTHLVERAEAALRAEAKGDGLPGQLPDEPQAQRVGVSGVAHVRNAEQPGKPRAKPWQVRRPGDDGHLGYVAEPREAAAVLEAWQHVGKIVGDRADVKACRKAATRMAGDLIDGQAVLPLGDGLEGWLSRQGAAEKQGDRDG